MEYEDLQPNGIEVWCVNCGWTGLETELPKGGVCPECKADDISDDFDVSEPNESCPK